jgi:hypothetical protein
MSKMIELNLRPDANTLRQFGYIAVVGFGGLALCAWNEWLIFAFGLGELKLGVVSLLGGLAGLSLLFSLVYPKANLPIYLGLSIVAYPIGFVLSYVIMGTLFFGLIGPVAIFFKLIGRDPMHRSYDSGAESYWSDARPQRPQDAYFRQF